MIGFELLRGEESRLHARGFEGLKKSLSHRLVDLQAAHVEAVDPSSADDVFAGAVITGDAGAPAIMRA